MTHRHRHSTLLFLLIAATVIALTFAYKSARAAESRPGDLCFGGGGPVHPCTQMEIDHFNEPVSTEPDGFVVDPAVTDMKGNDCFIRESDCLNRHAECFQGRADPGWTPAWSSLPDTVCASRNNSEDGWTTWGHSKERGMYAAHEEPQQECKGGWMFFAIGAILAGFICLLIAWRDR